MSVLTEKRLNLIMRLNAMRFLDTCPITNYMYNLRSADLPSSLVITRTTISFTVYFQQLNS